jgi:hypothetical protein
LLSIDSQDDEKGRASVGQTNEARYVTNSTTLHVSYLPLLLSYASGDYSIATIVVLETKRLGLRIDMPHNNELRH